MAQIGSTRKYAYRGTGIKSNKVKMKLGLIQELEIIDKKSFKKKTNFGVKIMYTISIILIISIILLNIFN